MTAVINFTPLFGIAEDEPFCYLLQIDDCCILLDCGWDEQFDEQMLRPLKQYSFFFLVVFVSVLRVCDRTGLSTKLTLFYYPTLIYLILERCRMLVESWD
jgi:hypothetical protein